MANGDPTETIRRRLALLAQGRSVFPELTVLENLELGSYKQSEGEAGCSGSSPQHHRLRPWRIAWMMSSASEVRGGTRQT